MSGYAQPLSGYLALLALGWVLSERRGAVAWRTVAGGVLLQAALAWAVFTLPGVRGAFAALNGLLLALQAATREGTSLVFGYLGGGALPFDENGSGASFVLAFQALPIILVMSALSALLYHWRVLPLLVRGMSWLLTRLLAVGGAVGLASAANVFVGMVEAPLLIRPYLERLSRGELFVVMSAGMASVAGSVMALYAAVLAPVVPDALGHILAASLISAPAAIVFASLMVPTERPPGGAAAALPRLDQSTMGAITRGTTEGLQLLLHVVAMLIVLVALVALVNALLGALPGAAGGWTLQRIAGLLMTPLAWLTGIPAAEASTAGALLGSKLVLNELVAYLDLAGLPAESLAPRSRLIMLYALCGFANFGSLGILIGGLSVMAPARRGDILTLAPRTLVSGTLATLSSGALVALLTAP